MSDRKKQCNICPFPEKDIPEKCRSTDGKVICIQYYNQGIGKKKA